MLRRSIIKKDINWFHKAIYNDYWYIGQVLEIDNTDGEIHVNFLEASGKYRYNFKWPQKMDDLWITQKDILYIMKHQPQKSGKTGRLFKLHIEDLDSLKKEYKDINMINLITVDFVFKLINTSSC